MEYTGHVVYTPVDGSLRVRVEAIYEFHFIFRAPPRGDGEGAVLPEVLPETYEEGMLYLAGRRTWHNATCRGPSPSLEEEGGGVARCDSLAAGSHSGAGQKRALRGHSGETGTGLLHGGFE